MWFPLVKQILIFPEVFERELRKSQEYCSAILQNIKLGNLAERFHLSKFRIIKTHFGNCYEYAININQIECTRKTRKSELYFISGRRMFIKFHYPTNDNYGLYLCQCIFQAHKKSHDRLCNLVYFFWFYLHKTSKEKIKSIQKTSLIK